MSQIIDAPLYLPAAAFELPKRLPRRLSTHETAIADLQQNPAAWAIVVKEIPRIEARIGNEQLKVHLGNFAFRDLLQFGIVQPAALDRIDVQLRDLPEVK